MGSYFRAEKTVRESIPVTSRRSLTKLVKLDKLLLDRKSAQIVMRAMISCNDEASIRFVNYKADLNDELPPEIGGYVRNWSIRMLVLHCDESLRIVKDICSRDVFKRILLNTGLIADLKSIEPLLNGGSEEATFRDRVRFVRDKIGAHYDENAILSSMAFRSRDSRKNLGRIQLSTAPFETRFFVAEDVVTTLIVRQAWKLTSEGDELEKEGDAVSDWFIQKSTQIHQFLVHFILCCMDAGVM